ncbi:MAG TPA: YncE family protein [Bryobacteraceae bacterium]
MPEVAAISLSSFETISYGVAVNPTGTRVYVTSYPGTVSVIDTSSNAVIAAIATGASEPTGIAVNPAGSGVYVTNQDDANVTVIDTSANTVVAYVFVGLQPAGVAVNPAGTRVYVVPTPRLYPAACR